MSFLNALSPDFLQRLSGGNMDPAQPNDEQDMGQLMGGVPQDAFQQHAANALSQMDPQEYAGHVTPGVGGTNPLGGLGKGMLGSLAGSLVGNLLGNQMGGGMGSLAGSLAGSVLGGQAAQGGIGGLASMLGLSHTNPQQMSEEDVAKLAAHAQQNNPGALAGAGLAAGVMSGQLKPKF